MVEKMVSLELSGQENARSWKCLVGEMFSRGNLSEVLRRTVIQGTAQYGDCLGIRKNYGDIFSL